MSTEEAFRRRAATSRQSRGKRKIAARSRCQKVTELASAAVVQAATGRTPTLEVHDGETLVSNEFR